MCKHASAADFSCQKLGNWKQVLRWTERQHKRQSAYTP